MQDQCKKKLLCSLSKELKTPRSVTSPFFNSFPVMCSFFKVFFFYHSKVRCLGPSCLGCRYFTLMNCNYFSFFGVSDEDTDVKAIVQTWLNKLPEADRDRLTGWIEDHFYKGMEFVLKQVIIYHSLLTLHFLSQGVHHFLCLYHCLLAHMQELIGCCAERKPIPGN